MNFLKRNRRKIIAFFILIFLSFYLFFNVDIFVNRNFLAKKALHEIIDARATKNCYEYSKFGGDFSECSENEEPKCVLKEFEIKKITNYKNDFFFVVNEKTDCFSVVLDWLEKHNSNLQGASTEEKNFFGILTELKETRDEGTFKNMAIKKTGYFFPKFTLLKN
jgi:hypothetical protein